jgi:predicted ATPase
MRIGVHTGEVEGRGKDYFGHAVNLVARLVEAGHGGQCLLSEETHAALDREFTAWPLGRFKLRGLKRAVSIYQLETSSPVKDFPPLRGIEATPNNLPEQSTSFVGREQERRDILALLDCHRLVTLCGMGGTGKTRLTLEIAREMLDRHDAVWFVEFANVTDPRLVPEALAAALGVRVGSQSVVDVAVEYLRDLRALLIFDNCEQVIEATANLADSLLRHIPGLKVLASSREGLAIAGEAIYQLAPLDVPKGVRRLSVDDVRSFGAVQLFLERASAANSNFHPEEQNPEMLVQLCTRLDGIPLAIELAAARIRSMSADQILHRLDDRFRLLTTGSRAALPRQKTLRALVDWSYDLLQPAEKALLLRLSVFVNGWDLDAAEAVCAGDSIEPYEVLDLLCSLVEKSLVICDTKNRANPRYRLLEMVRQYALDRIAEGEGTPSSDLRDRHGDYYLACAEAHAPKLVGEDAAEALNRLDEEHDNLRAALTWWTQSSPSQALRLVIALQRFWMTRGHLREGLERARSALALETPAHDLRTRALFVAAFCSMSLGEIEESRAYFDEALALARTSGDRIQEGRALSGLAGIAGDFDVDHRRSLELNKQALAIHAEVGNQLGQAAANYNIADLTVRHDPRLADPETASVAIAEAEGYFRAGLALFTDLRDVKHQGICLSGLAVASQRQGQPEAALAYFLAALELFDQVGDSMWCGNLYKSLAWLLWQSDHRDEAVLLAGLGVEQHEVMGFVPPVLEGAWWEEVMRTLSGPYDEEEFQALFERGRSLTAADALQILNQGGLVPASQLV